MTGPALVTGPAPGAGVSGPEFRQFMRSWPTGLAVITAGPAGQPGRTVNSFVSVSLRPPLVLVSLGQASRTLAAVAAQGAFGISVLAAAQRHLAERFAVAADDQFAGVPHRWQDGVPLLAQAAAQAVCAVQQSIPAADHVLVLGQPRWCACGGQPELLIFSGGAYQSLPAAPG